jgi:hypothetical protein
MDCHAGFLSGRLISSNEETWVLFHHDYPYAVPRTLFQCVCTRRRNCIGQLSPFSEYAPGTARFPGPFPLVHRFVLRPYLLMLDRHFAALR